MNRTALNGAPLNGTRSLVVILATANLVATATFVPFGGKAIAASAGFSASGTFVGNGVRQLQPTAALTGAGTLTVWSAQQTIALDAALLARATFYPLVYSNVPATGGFTGTATLYAVPAAKFATAAFAAAGAFVVTATVIEPGGGAALGKATLAGAPIAYRYPTADFGGRARLRGEPDINNRKYAYADFDGFGGIVVDNLGVLNAGDFVVFRCYADLVGLSTQKQSAQGAWSGVATLAPTPVRTVTPTAEWTAGATFAPVATRERRATAAPVGAATLLATPRMTQQAAGAPVGVGGMTANAELRRMATGALAGVATMQASCFVYAVAQANAIGTATLAAQALINPGADETAGEEFVRAVRTREFARAFKNREWDTAMGIVGTVEQQPREIEDYTISYDDDLSDTDEVSAIVSIEVEPAGSLTTNGGLILSGGRKVTFSANDDGLDGTKYKVTVLVDTTEGRRLEDELYIKIRSK